MSLVEKIVQNLALLKLKKNHKPSQINAQNLSKNQSLNKKLQLSSTRPGIASIIQRLHRLNQEEKEKNQKTEPIDEPTIKTIKENFEPAQGGYGTTDKTYGQSPQASYTDYSKLFSHLGKFRAATAYSTASGEGAASAMDRLNFSLVDENVRDTGSRHIRYFSKGSEISMVSMAPIAGMTPEEWSSFKLWMQLDPVMYRFKTTTS